MLINKEYTFNNYYFNVGFRQVFRFPKGFSPQKSLRTAALCKHCKAKQFAAENPQNGKFSSSCHKGKINLPPMTPPPE